MLRIIPCIAGCWLACCASLSLAADPPARLPVPDMAALDKATAEVKEVYGAAQLSAKTRQTKLEFAKRLRRDAADTKEDPAAQLVMFRAALAIAVSQGDVTLAMDVCKEIETRFQLDNTRLPPLQELVAKEASPKLFQAASEQVAACLARDDFATALAYAKLAEKAAKSDVGLLKKAQATRSQIEIASAEQEAIRAHQQKLMTDALDPVANLAVGRFLCLRKNQWEQGLTYLALGQDRELAKLAESELVAPTEADAQLKLADGWWDYALRAPATDQLGFKQRGAHWYQTALAKLADADKARARARLLEAPPLARFLSLDLLKPGDVLFRDWNGSTWSVNASPHMSLQREDGKWMLTSNSTEGHGNRMAFFRSIDAREKKLQLKCKVLEGFHVHIAVRPMDGSDDRFCETRGFRAGDTIDMMMFVRDGKVYNVVNGTPYEIGDELKGQGPFVYAIILNRQSKIEIESLKFE